MTAAEPRGRFEIPGKKQNKKKKQNSKPGQLEDRFEKKRLNGGERHAG
jgi:hypothetical protein